jgi:predicted N-acetyltransferase YhbS
VFFRMLTIRPEKLEDIPAIRQVNMLTFGQPNEADLVDALRRAGVLLLSLVAVKDDLIVGHIAGLPPPRPRGNRRGRGRNLNRSLVHRREGSRD